MNKNCERQKGKKKNKKKKKKSGMWDSQGKLKF